MSILDKPLSVRVRDTLLLDPTSRKSDISLCSIIWNEECLSMGENLTDMDAFTFLHYTSIGKLSKQQTILRIARKVRNLYPHLKNNR